MLQFMLDTSARMNRIVLDQTVLDIHPPASVMVQTLTSAKDAQQATVTFLLPSYFVCSGNSLADSAAQILCPSLSPDRLVPSDGVILAYMQSLPGDNTPLIQVRTPLVKFVHPL
jgi:hypothetical protein